MALYRDDYCTCRARAVRSDDIDPPEIKRDRNCPVHGVDPDELRDRKEAPDTALAKFKEVE